jgi:hypothetical protein
VVDGRGEKSSLGKPNVSLREFKYDDWKYVHEYASQERACQYQPWGPNSEGDTKTFVSAIVEMRRKNHVLVLLWQWCCRKVAR